MRRFSRVTLIAAAVLGLLSSSAYADVADSQLNISHAEISFVLLNCRIDALSSVLVNDKNEDGIEWQIEEIAPQHVASQRQYDDLFKTMPRRFVPAEVRIQMRPGYYPKFKLAVGTCKFSAFPLIVGDIYGRRTIAVVAGRRESDQSLVGSVGGVSGLIPDSHMTVQLVSKRTRESFAGLCYDASDMLGPRSTYYVDGVPPGDYTLVLGTITGRVTIGTVRVRSGRVTTRDVEFSELLTH